jgi:hypothetical protein
MGSAALA